MVLPFQFFFLRDYCTHLAWMDFLMPELSCPFYFELDIKNKLNRTKNGRSKMWSPPKRGFPKFKVFNLLSWKHEVFFISKQL